MSILDRIMELEAEKQKLLSQAKNEALKAAEKAVADLNNLGFAYRLVEDHNTPTSSTTTRTRRSGVTDDVLAVIKASKDGMNRSAILAALGANDIKAQQSISNALANMKKKGVVNHAEDGTYTAV